MYILWEVKYTLEKYLRPNFPCTESMYIQYIVCQFFKNVHVVAYREKESDAFFNN